MKKPEKPLYRQPCNGCGLCCLEEQCAISEIIFGSEPRCPALIDAGSRYACGLIAEPERYFKDGHAAEGAMRAGKLLGIGTYCDTTLTDADHAVARALGEAGYA